MEEYITLAGAGSFTYEDRRSVFIGEAAPVTREEEALSHIAAVKKRYPDARHHVYAYILRENSIMRFSDDSEPQGTAGLPTLDILRKRGITDAVITVTRYFGGTLLGTGGLVRAYTAAAGGAVRTAGLAHYRMYAFCEIRMSYADYSKLAPTLTEALRLSDTRYEDAVTLFGSLPKEEYPALLHQLTEQTAGRAEIRLLCEKFDF